MRKRSIFWEKPWTNPFAKCRLFSSLWELHFWGPKSIIFHPEYQRMFLSGFFCLKKTDKKKVDYWQKPWTNPFAKCQYFLTLLELHFSGLKSIVFYPEYQKMFLSGFFGSKKNIWEKGRFFDKNHVLTLCKMSIFFTLLEFHFSGLKSILYYPE